MGMDFRTQERIDEVDIFHIDRVSGHEFEVVADNSRAVSPSWLELISYWIGELRWRVKFWNSERR